MDISAYPPMESRPCRFCLNLQGSCVFVDFDVDADDRLFAVRVSYDGFGCCHAPADIGRMNTPDSKALLAMAEAGVFDDSAERILRSYFRHNRDVLWIDALEQHDLL